MMGISAACVGRLGADAELKYTAAAKAVLRWSMVTTNTREQERGRPDEWVRVACFGQTAEALAESGRLVKGSEVYAEGTLTVARWESADGPRTALELAAFVVQPLAAFKRPQGTGAPLPSARQAVAAGAVDDIPF